MFTGLIERTGVVEAATPSPSGVRLQVAADGFPRPTPGDSICVSGCCLTLAAELEGGNRLVLAFDVIPETLRTTTLGRLVPGHKVNLEPSATPTTLLGGHIVQGHVDGVARVERVQTVGETRLRLRPPAELLEYLVPKGSVAVDGVSLTIAALDVPQGWFEVALIPVTLAKTTLADLREGDQCNLETDILAKTTVHWLKHFAPGHRG